MDYFKAFETIKSSLEKSELSLKDEHLAIQVILTDEDCGGILYIENYFKKLNVMPYDYYDNNVNVISDYASFIELITAKKNLGALLDKITIKGDFEAAKEFFDSIKPKKTRKKAEPKKAVEKKKADSDKPAKKTKKADTEKKPVKKATKKESEKVKMTAKNKDEAKSTIEKVVETESKPAKKETKK